MPQGIHEIDLELPIGAVWDFVSVLENWIPLVPGYISHEIINDRRVTWTFLGDIGIMKKKISLQVDITKWNEPTEVRFTLTGINDNFTGEGYFKATALGEQRTRMTGFLDITAKGLKAPMINSILKTHVPQMTTDLVEAIADRMRKVYR
ncbi:CoxG family protein [Brevibacillus reuszeri]|uniref:CoxG family protein n=1 Tax=Brevibacillus reuszeri TaxID=54915 RepID=UPI000CCC8219|nr:SRPBCC family protein [Brevibacillus reuszeri]